MSTGGIHASLAIRIPRAKLRLDEQTHLFSVIYLCLCRSEMSDIPTIWHLRPKIRIAAAGGHGACVEGWVRTAPGRHQRPVSGDERREARRRPTRPRWGL